MSSVRFRLADFEGPLDLLLQLIDKHKLNIYDIEITLLLEQYMEFINNLDHEDYDDAADFLEMAARLIYIKTCSLLPHDEESQALKKELEGSLIEYSLCKKASENLKAQYIGNEVFVRNPVKLPVNKTYSRVHDKNVLVEAYMGLSEKSRKVKPLKAEMFEPIVSHKIVSVTSKIIYILKRLYKTGEFDMAHLYDGMETKSERVATFLAVLELTKSGRIYLNDDNSMIFFNPDSRHKNEKTEAEEKTETEEVFPEEDEFNVPAEDFFDEEKPTYEKISDYVPKKSDVKNIGQSMACAVEIREFPDEEPKEKEKMDNSELHKNAEKEQDISQQLEQLVLSGLSTQPPETVFKPNYWNSLSYYWGNSPVGDDNYGNYWKYGKMRF